MAVTAALAVLACWLGGLIIYVAIRDVCRGWQWQQNQKQRRKHGS